MHCHVKVQWRSRAYSTHKTALLASRRPVCHFESLSFAYTSSGRRSTLVLFCSPTSSRWRLPSTAFDPATTKRPKGSKQRLDDYCLQKHPQYSKNVIQTWIQNGKVPSTVAGPASHLDRAHLLMQSPYTSFLVYDHMLVAMFSGHDPENMPGNGIKQLQSWGHSRWLQHSLVLPFRCWLTRGSLPSQAMHCPPALLWR